VRGREKCGKWQQCEQRVASNSDVRGEKGGKWCEGREKGGKEQQHEEKKGWGAAEV